MGYDKKSFPVVWGDEGVDVSRDEFVTRIGTQKDKRYHVGSNFKFDVPRPKPDAMSTDLKKYICMVGKCSGVIDEKPKED